MGGNAPSNARR